MIPRFTDQKQAAAMVAANPRGYPVDSHVIVGGVLGTICIAKGTRVIRTFSKEIPCGRPADGRRYTPGLKANGILYFSVSEPE